MKHLMGWIAIHTRFAPVILFVLANTAFAAQADWKKDWEQTLSAAKKEGQVNVYIYRYERLLQDFKRDFPGINVVSAADFAGEMGPIEHYANPRAITGRSGLRPSRYQSDQVDKANGPLVRHCNRSLRAAILCIADNLILCNHHFQHLARQWAQRGKNPRDIRVRVAQRFCRIAFPVCIAKIVDNDLRAARGESKGMRTAQARARTGYDRNPIIKSNAQFWSPRKFPP